MVVLSVTAEVIEIVVAFFAPPCFNELEMKPQTNFKTILGATVLIAAVIAIGVLINRQNQTPVTVTADVDPSELNIKAITKLKLSDGVEIRDVGYKPEILKDLMTPAQIRIVFISSYHCEDCKTEPNLIIYNVNAMKRVSTDLPGTFTISTANADTDTNEPLDPYLSVRIFYGLCGQAQFGVWSFSHSVDDGFYKRVNFSVVPTDITFTVDKLTAEEMDAEVKNFKQLQQCEALPERNFVTQ